MNNGGIIDSNKEKYNQIIDDAYNNFLMTSKKGVSKEILEKFIKHTPNIHKIEFIDKIKRDKRFSEYWGLKIEERELSWEEQVDLALEWGHDSFDLDIAMCNSEDALTEYGIPTRVLTVTYKDEKLEIYE